MLPTEKTQPKQRFIDYSILLYGQSKIGKTTFCAGAEKALFIDCEKGTGGLETYTVNAKTLKDVWRTLKELNDNPDHGFTPIVVDTVDELHRMCIEHVRKEKGVEHESDLEWGRGHAAVRETFIKTMKAFIALDCGSIFISHSRMVEIATKVGKRSKMQPTIPGRALEEAMAVVDMILYADFHLSKNAKTGEIKQARKLFAAATAEFDAGDRSSLLPKTVPMKISSLEKYFNKKKTGGKQDKAEQSIDSTKKENDNGNTDKVQ